MHGYTQDVVDPASPNQAWGFKSTSQWATLAQQHEFYVIFPEKPALCRCEGGAYGCSTSCAALGKKESGGCTWPGNHAATLVTGAYPTVWKSATAKKPRLLVFQGDADGAVTPENMADVVQQWKGATAITGAGTTSTRKGHDHTEYTMDGQTQLATILMHGIGHGTPVDPGPGADQGGWDPVPSQTASSDANAKQDWTNSAGIWGPYYSAKFFGLIP